MARVVGVTTRPRRPFPLASSSSSPPPPNSPPSAPPATKRRKVNHRGGPGASQEKEEKQQELTMLRMLGSGGEGDSSITVACKYSIAGQRSGEIERCSTSRSSEAEEELGNCLGCSRNGSSEGASEFFSDLQQEDEEEEEGEMKSWMNCSSSSGGERRDSTNSRSTVIENSGEFKSMERPELRNSSAAVKDPRQNSAAVSNMERVVVMDAEWDVFFSMNGENEELNRLNEKYNFDFANEKPLAGRYDWILLKP